ncbi:hypothetical protein [Thiolapillus sp.]|uniref:hypothetical protein n=1 Tax=Thiolapillus sp. TaxID=2017437 RepID=UPI003AF9C0F9
MTRTAGAQIGCQRPSRFWGLGCPKIYHEVEDTLVQADSDCCLAHCATVCPGASVRRFEARRPRPPEAGGT